jgi:hypothetical protein
MPCSNDDFWDLVDQLPEVTPVEGSTYTAQKVRGKGFGYHRPSTATAGLKQERQEQIALVTERPDVFETQFVAGQFGWVVVHLERIEPTELAELVYEAWRLTAPVRLATAYGDRPPSLTGSKRQD